MGGSHSMHVDGVEDEDEEKEGSGDADADADAAKTTPARRLSNATHLVKKTLEQEPEILPCHASASPLSPQLSSLGTPRLGPSIKVWDPYNVLAPPPPPPPPLFSRCFSSPLSSDADRTVTEVFLINHGESEISLRPELVAGRSPGMGLTPNGKRQARALAVFLKSQGVQFSAVYSSPLERAMATAVSVCLDMNFPAEQIQSSDSLVEMSLGNWEGCLRSETFTPEVLNWMDRFQPDFSAPSGESLRQVEFRVAEFLTGMVLGMPENPKPDLLAGPTASHAHGNPVHERGEPPSKSNNQWDLLHRNRQGLLRKKSGKSRLQNVNMGGDEEGEDDGSPSMTNTRSFLFPSQISHVGVFTHSTPIKCLVTGLLGCSAAMSRKICIEDSSVTVLRHMWSTGWEVQRLNDAAHLRLL